MINREHKHAVLHFLKLSCTNVQSPLWNVLIPLSDGAAVVIEQPKSAQQWCYRKEKTKKIFVINVGGADAGNKRKCIIKLGKQFHRIIIIPTLQLDLPLQYCLLFVKQFCGCVSHAQNEMLGKKNSCEFPEHNIYSYCFIFYS